MLEYIEYKLIGNVLVAFLFAELEKSKDVPEKKLVTNLKRRLSLSRSKKGDYCIFGMFDITRKVHISGYVILTLQL